MSQKEIYQKAVACCQALGYFYGAKNEKEIKRVKKEFVEFLDKNEYVDWRFGVFEYIVLNQEGIEMLSEFDVYLAYKCLNNSPINLLRKLTFFLFFRYKLERRFKEIESSLPFFNYKLGTAFVEGFEVGLSKKNLNLPHSNCLAHLRWF